MNKITKFLNHKLAKLSYYGRKKLSINQQQNIIFLIENNQLDELKSTITSSNDLNFIYDYTGHDYHKLSPLSFACSLNNLEIVDYLLKQKASFDYQNSYCFFNIFSATKKVIRLGFFSKTETIEKEEIPLNTLTLEKIIYNTQNLHAVDNNGVNIFSHVCKYLSEENKHLADHILKQGVKTTSLLSSEKTNHKAILELPIVYAKNNSFALNYLLEHGANPIQLNHENYSFINSVQNDELFLQCLDYYDKNNPEFLKEIHEHIKNTLDISASRRYSHLGTFGLKAFKNDPYTIRFKNYLEISQKYLDKHNLAKKIEQISTISTSIGTNTPKKIVKL
jgi:hypothetical protein